MINKYLKYLNLKCYAFSLFEVTLTLVISSIALAITGTFVASSVNIVTEVASQATSSATSTVALNVLTGDFVNNVGGVDVGTRKDDKNNTLTLRFDIPDTSRPGREIRVKYICDYDLNQVFRQLAGYTQELFLDQMTACDFTTSISADQTTITLTTNITIMSNGTPIILSEVTDAPYTH